MAERSRDRSRSPYKHRKEHRRRSEDRHRHDQKHVSQTEEKTVTLPFQQRQLSKHDLREYRPMFALYLDIQKQIYVEDLSEEEIKGRWKSFIKKWLASRCRNRK